MSFLTGAGVGSKRYQIAISPIGGLNGKMAPSKLKCSPQIDSSSNGVKYFYGYVNSGVGVARFALRSKCRNLSEHPLSANENNVRMWFTQAIAAVKIIMQDPSQVEAQLAAYKANPKNYTSLRTWLIAKEIENLKNG